MYQPKGFLSAYAAFFCQLQIQSWYPDPLILLSDKNQMCCSILLLCYRCRCGSTNAALLTVGSQDFISMVPLSCAGLLVSQTSWCLLQVCCNAWQWRSMTGAGLVILAVGTVEMWVSLYTFCFSTEAFCTAGLFCILDSRSLSLLTSLTTAVVLSARTLC